MDIPRNILDICKEIRADGGRAIIVGGFVRDHFLDMDSKDIDIEVFGLEPDKLINILSKFGSVDMVGRAFGVFRISGLDVDFSVPRRESKTGSGHKSFDIDFDCNMTFEEASRRRDLTINAMGFDPVSEEVLDPHDGKTDLVLCILRAVDSKTFIEDPLRALRVAQFAARFEMEPDQELVKICSSLDLSELPSERIFEEFRKMLMKGKSPSWGLRFLREANLLRFFPEIEGLIGVPQDVEHHPEGDVFEHTLMVTDAAVVFENEALMFGALCHDMGKAVSTQIKDGKVTSHGHEDAGVPIIESFLERINAPSLLKRKVIGLTRLHMMPPVFSRATDRAFRRLSRKCAKHKITMGELGFFCLADQLGREAKNTEQERVAIIQDFMNRAQGLNISSAPLDDVVKGRHLIARGMKPGPEFSVILKKCRDIQDTTGETDPEVIINKMDEEIQRRER